MTVWTDPRTWTAGELVTESIMNTHVRDNLTVLRPDVCIVKRTANQTLTNDTLTWVEFTDERTDTAGMHDNSTNNHRINILRAGIYLISLAYIQFTAHASGFDYVWVESNSGAYYYEEIRPANSSIGNTFSTTFLAIMAAGTWVGLRAKQTSGGNLDLTYNASGASPNFAAILLKDTTT